MYEIWQSIQLNVFYTRKGDTDMDKLSLNLYKNEEINMAQVEELKELMTMAQSKHPFLFIKWVVKHTLQGKAIVKMNLLNCETEFSIPDAIASARRLAQ